MHYPSAALMLLGNVAVDGRRHLAGACLTLALLAPPLAQAAWQQTVLYNFEGRADGSNPMAPLVADKSGALYGTSSGLNGRNKFHMGSVFKLTPPAAGQTKWGYTLIWEFRRGTHDGAVPMGGVVFDSSGALYGTTEGGGTTNGGIVFKLTPPAAGQTAWTETILANLTGGTVAGVLPRPDGALYGVTTGGGNGAGTVFRLSPPAQGQTKWRYTRIHAFQDGIDGMGPRAALIADSSGALYGTTSQGGAANAGTVFKLTPPANGQTAWTRTVLHAFQHGTDGAAPVASVTLGKNGVLYGTTELEGNPACTIDIGCGTVFSLTPPSDGGTAWVETVLHSFNGPDGAYPTASVIIRPDGKLLSITAEGGAADDGVAFQLTPPVTGQTNWSGKLLHIFTGGKDGGAPLAGLLLRHGTYFGTTERGGKIGYGTVFALTP
jgi:uncharacterized repeat protein (TIGR03803 family)